MTSVKQVLVNCSEGNHLIFLYPSGNVVPHYGAHGKMCKASNRPLERKTMQPHQERVVNEKKELDGRLDKLKAFIEVNPTFKALSEDEQHRLNRQFDAMAEYSSILGQRIAAFE